MLCDSFAEILEKRFEVKRVQNPLYSLRAFARDLGVSSGQLSMILSKKRGVSADSAEKMAKALKLNRVEKQYFLQLAIQEHGRSKRIKDMAHDKLGQIRAVEEGINLSQDQFTIISEWYHMAILQVMQLKGYVKRILKDGELRFISQRLSISEEIVQSSLEHLLKLKAITFHGGHHLPAADFVMVPGSLPSASIKKFQKQFIQKSIEALDFQDSKSCAFKTTLLSIDSNDYSKINDEISEFCKNMMIKYGKSQSSEVKPNQVYILSQQFFKLAEVKQDE